MLNQLELSKGNISNWKNGGMPSVEVLRQLSNRLSVSTDYLLGNTDDPTPPQENKPINEDELGEDVVIYCRNGKTVKKHFTAEEMRMISTMLDSLGDTYNDDL